MRWFVIDGFVEFSGAVLPELVGVDGAEDVGDVGGESGQRWSFFVFAFAVQSLFALH